MYCIIIVCQVLTIVITCIMHSISPTVQDAMQPIHWFRDHQSFRKLQCDVNINFILLLPWIQSLQTLLVDIQCSPWSWYYQSSRRLNYITQFLLLPLAFTITPNLQVGKQRTQGSRGNQSSRTRHPAYDIPAYPGVSTSSTVRIYWYSSINIVWASF